MSHHSLPSIDPAVVHACRSAGRVLVTGHLRADGDCLGAGIVVARCLRQLGAEVEIVMPDPPDPRYGFLYRKTPWALYDSATALPAFDLLVVADCNELSRLGDLEPVLRKHESRRLLLDHHPLGDDADFWGLRVHDTGAAASGLLAVRLAHALGTPLDEASCEAAFVALMTDTGWLRYSNAGAEAFAVAAELVAGGIQPSSLYRELYQRQDAGTPRGLGLALSGVRYVAGGLGAVAAVSDAALAEVGGSLAESDELLDVLRAVDTVEAVAFLSERQGAVKVSFRSKQWLDVNALARQCGGGGHARAAGATLDPKVTLAEARQRIEALLEQALAEQRPMPSGD